jgi:hypothetical protein
MKSTQIQSAILWSGLLLSTAAVPAYAVSIVIFSVQTDSARTHLTINGQGFSTGDKVSLGLTDISTQCSLGSPSGTVITCAFAQPIIPGAYRLVVSNPLTSSSSIATSDVFDVTTPIIGPAGPAGPQGPIGPTGPIGPQGALAPLARSVYKDRRDRKVLLGQVST